MRTLFILFCTLTNLQPSNDFHNFNLDSSSIEGIRSFCIHRSNLEQALSVYEQLANYAGLIPVISSASGLIRVGIGAAQILGGLYVHDEDMFLHGVANLSRGAIETTWIISVVFSVVYDGYLEKRFCYPHEVQIANPWQLCRTAHALFTL